MRQLPHNFYITSTYICKFFKAEKLVFDFAVFDGCAVQ